jgi:hypothetical protein
VRDSILPPAEGPDGEVVGSVGVENILEKGFEVRTGDNPVAGGAEEGVVEVRDEDFAARCGEDAEETRQSQL